MRSTADATVRGGTFSASNYGSEPLLEIKASPSAFYVRESFLKFDVENFIGQQVSSVTFSFSLSSESAPIDNLQVYAASDDWSEMTISDSNKPAQGALLGTITSGTQLTLDLNLVKQAMSDGTLTLKLVKPAVSLNIYRLMSRESGNMALRPQLFVAVGGTNSQLGSQMSSIGLTVRLNVDAVTIMDNIELFASQIATVLSIPVEAIPTDQILVQADADGYAVVSFVITNFMNEDVDVFAAANKLEALIEANDSSLADTYLADVQIMAQSTDSGEEQEAAGEEEETNSASLGAAAGFGTFVLASALLALF